MMIADDQNALIGQSLKFHIKKPFCTCTHIPMCIRNYNGLNVFACVCVDAVTMA